MMCQNLLHTQKLTSSQLKGMSDGQKLVLIYIVRTQILHLQNFSVI